MFKVKLKSETLMAFDVNEAFKDIRKLKTFLKNIEHGPIVKDKDWNVIFIGTTSIMTDCFIVLDEKDKFFSFNNIYTREMFLEKFERC